MICCTSNNSQSDHQSSSSSDQNTSGLSFGHTSTSLAIKFTPSTPPPGHVWFSLPHTLESQESEDKLEEDETAFGGYGVGQGVILKMKDNFINVLFGFLN